MDGLVSSKLTYRPKAKDPKEDPVKLAAIGDAVRARLAANPMADNIGGDKADLFLVRNFFTPTQCARLIKICDARIGPSTLFKGTQQDGFRTSSTHHFDASDTATSDLERRLDDLLGLDHKHAEVTQGQRYLPGQQFKHHFDYFFNTEDYWQTERRRGGQRSWTAMLCLNQPEEGGETDWPELGFSIRPETGMLVTWNNMARNGTPNRNTFHAGMPVLRGKKYVVTQWYRQDEWSLALQ